MKKLILLLPGLLLVVLLAFLGCTKEAPAPAPPKTNDTIQFGILNMTRGEDGMMDLSFSSKPSGENVVNERDGCTMYQAIRFTVPNADPPEPPISCDDRFNVDVRFRLISYNPSTHTASAVTSYTTITNVGGLNLSWFNMPPSTIYGIQYAFCYESGVVNGGDFIISEFWNDDIYVQGNPWDCANRDGSVWWQGPIPGSVGSPADQILLLECV